MNTFPGPVLFRTNWSTCPVCKKPS